jgi:predicted DNA-binding protein YlxM (UPF0122 family)
MAKVLNLLYHDIGEYSIGVEGRVKLSDSNLLESLEVSYVTAGFALGVSGQAVHQGIKKAEEREENYFNADRLYKIFVYFRHLRDKDRQEIVAQEMLSRHPELMEILGLRNKSLQFG